MKGSPFCIIAIVVTCDTKQMYALRGCSGRLLIKGKYI